MASREAEPTIARRRLARLLKEWRERAGITHASLESQKFASSSKMTRVESGKHAVALETVWALCGRYGCSPEEMAEATALCEGANQPGWIEEFFGVVPDWLGIYAGLEGAADEIQTYDPELVHALLQTPEYARAVIGTAEGITPGRLDQLVEFRLERQKRALEGEHDAKITCLIGEAALKYRVGEPQLMKDQIRHLERLSTRVGILILPFSAGLHPWMNGSFAIISFDAELGEKPFVYSDTHTGARYLETEKHLTEYRKIFGKLIAKGIPIKEMQ